MTKKIGFGFRAWSVMNSAETGLGLGGVLIPHCWGSKKVLQDNPPIFDLSDKDTLNENPSEDFGFYAFYESSPLLEDDTIGYGHVLGVIRPFGTVVKHELGFRSQGAEIVALCHDPRCGCGCLASLIVGSQLYCTEHSTDPGGKVEVITWGEAMWNLSTRYPGVEWISTTEMFLYELKEESDGYR